MKKSRKGKTYEEIYGKEKAKEVREKIKSNNAHYWKDKKKSKDHIDKIAESKKGSIPWNKGLTKETSEIVAKYGKNSGLSRRGKPTWRSGTGKYPKGYGRKYITVDGKQWRMSHYVYCKANNLSKIKKVYCIHHIDGEHANNDIKNLKLMKHGEHSKLENKISKNKTGMCSP